MTNITYFGDMFRVCGSRSTAALLLQRNNRDHCVATKTTMLLEPQMRNMSPKYIILVMNEVPVARLGLILSQDGATLTRKLFKYFPAPFPPMFDPQTRMYGTIVTSLLADPILCIVFV